MKARANLKMGFADEAGRLAYLAAFDAAQAYIFTLTGKLAKTHKGVHNQFYLLTKEDKRLDEEIKNFLSRAYEMKAIADYEFGPSATLPQEAAIKAIAIAERFVDAIVGLIAD